MTTGKRVAILQSCYIPWRGYFDIIRQADIFIVYDDVQYRKNHWHNRNRIRTSDGTRWLTLPVSLPFGLSTTIDQVRVAPGTTIKHWKTIEQSYARAQFFDEFRDFVRECFSAVDNVTNLSDLNCELLQRISNYFKLSAQFMTSRSIGYDQVKTERLLSICKALGAKTYISGPAAKSYLDVALFQNAGIDIEWMDYSHYAPYQQQWQGYDPAVSIIDLIFNQGPMARTLIAPREHKPRSEVT